MTPKTLRRKLQKKAKHKPYRKCPRCGNRMVVVLTDAACDGDGWAWQLFKVCGTATVHGECIGRLTGGCGYVEELFWSGGGNSADASPTPTTAEGERLP